MRVGERIAPPHTHTLLHSPPSPWPSRQKNGREESAGSRPCEPGPDTGAEIKIAPGKETVGGGALNKEGRARGMGQGKAGRGPKCQAESGGGFC